MPAQATSLNNHSRLEALAREFGANTAPNSADWEKPLLSLAKEVYQEFTRPGGKNGYSRFGKDVLSVEDIVQKVFETWANSEHVTVTWFETLDEPMAMLRTFCQHAAQNVVNKNAHGHRQGVFVATTGFTGSGLTEDGDDAGESSGKFDWLANSKDYASDYAQPEEEVLERSQHERLEAVIVDIIETIPNETHRGLAYLYYVEGISVDDAALTYGVSKQNARQGLARARKALSDEDAACLIVWRNTQHTTEGRQSVPKARPVRLLQVLLAG